MSVQMMKQRTWLPRTTKLIDLKGRFMMPGIHDVHVHPLEAASENFKSSLTITKPTLKTMLMMLPRPMLQIPGLAGCWAGGIY